MYTNDTFTFNKYKATYSYFIYSYGALVIVSIVTFYALHQRSDLRDCMCALLQFIASAVRGLRRVVVGFFDVYCRLCDYINEMTHKLA